jgi:hypothetical protein
VDQAMIGTDSSCGQEIPEQGLLLQLKIMGDPKHHLNPGVLERNYQ